MFKPPRPKIGIASQITSIEKHGNLLFVVIKKPEGFSFLAGQYVTLRLPSLEGKSEGVCARAMSLASAPHENDLVIAMQLSDSLYKQEMQKLSDGDLVEIDGPFGYFTMHETLEPAIFLAGGIGIAPFRSLLLAEKANGWPHDITLFYSVGHLENAAFLSELALLQNNRFRIIVTVTRSRINEKFGVTMESGRICTAMIQKYVSNLPDNFCYIVGAPLMVSDIYCQLCESDIDPRKIMTELFTGYE
ncbi:MAG: FAD-dependent oxidoreductase [bacterium]|nr:FAD-dependent oxidoreductase [bacterium]